MIYFRRSAKTHDDYTFLIKTKSVHKQLVKYEI